MQFDKLSMQTKLILTFVVVGALPLISSNAISFLKTSEEINSQAAERAKLVAESKANEVSGYFRQRSESIVDLASNPMVVNALEQFSSPFERALPTPPADVVKRLKGEAEKFYSGDFGALYLEKTKNKPSTSEIVGKMDLLTLIAQSDFIFNNENPLGKKDALVTPHRKTQYGEAHANFHPFFQAFLSRHALYDLFLVNSQGRVVYSVFKESDFATSLTEGPWAHSGLAKAFLDSKSLNAGAVTIEDFSPYTPSYEAPASFAATPIFANNKFVGTLIIQLPLDKISAVAGNRSGLGEFGETLLLGSDGKLRADTFRNKQTHTVAAAFAPDSKISVESEAVKLAMSGMTGFTRNVSYDKHETLAYYQPIKIEKLNWYIVTELSSSEVFAGQRKIAMLTTAILVIGVFAIALVAYLLGGGIARRLRAIASGLDQSSQDVSSAAKASASSATELSEAATEQAASLQETMASIEQISAMVSQNAESASKTKVAVDANQKVSTEGSRSVEKMVEAIGEINSTNEEILAQMESSNEEFGHIVKIITEIGTKTNVINEIVFQTKLLSFNASVEAARAGEHGKGFAVVAEEVGNLAQMSGNAAKEITDMLSESIKKVNSIVENTKVRVDRLIETGRDKISTGQATAEQCRVALQKVTENATSITTMINEITQASKEQAQGVQEINKAISQLDEVTQQNSAVARQSSSQAEQLNAQAHELSDTVHQLIEFVEGSGKVPETESLAESKVGRVINLNHASRKVSAAAPSAPTRKAAGSDEVPSADSPGFEEF